MPRRSSAPRARAPTPAPGRPPPSILTNSTRASVTGVESAVAGSGVSGPGAHRGDGPGARGRPWCSRRPVSRRGHGLGHHVLVRRRRGDRDGGRRRSARLEHGAVRHPGRLPVGFRRGVDHGRASSTSRSTTRRRRRRWSDVTFLTPVGDRPRPAGLPGHPGGPGGLVMEGLDAYVQNQPVVATLVQAASGALVATELDQMVVSTGTGLALLAGTPGPSTSWQFAQTTAVQGGTVTLAVANPGDVADHRPHHGRPARGHGRAPTPGRAGTDRGCRSACRPSPAGRSGRPYSLTVKASAPIVVGRTVTAPAGGAVTPGGDRPRDDRRWLELAGRGPGGPRRPGHLRAAPSTPWPWPTPGRCPVDVHRHAALRWPTGGQGPGGGRQRRGVRTRLRSAVSGPDRQGHRSGRGRDGRRSHRRAGHRRLVRVPAR